MTLRTAPLLMRAHGQDGFGLVAENDRLGSRLNCLVCFCFFSYQASGISTFILSWPDNGIKNMRAIRTGF